MSLLDDLHENRDIITGNTPVVSLSAYEALAAKYGQEVALGYAMAMEDVRAALDELLFRRNGINTSQIETPTFVLKKSTEFRDQLAKTLSEIKRSENPPPTPI